MGIDGATFLSSFVHVTASLSTSALGSAVRLASWYSQHGPLPAEVGALAKIADASHDEFVALWKPQLEALFPLTRDGRVVAPQLADPSRAPVRACSGNTLLTPDRISSGPSSPYPPQGGNGGVQRGFGLPEQTKAGEVEKRVSKVERIRRVRAPIPTELATLPGFADAWEEFVRYRASEYRSGEFPMSLKAQQTQLAELARFPTVAVEAITDAIASDYRKPYAKQIFERQQRVQQRVQQRPQAFQSRFATSRVVAQAPEEDQQRRQRRQRVHGYGPSGEGT